MQTIFKTVVYIETSFHLELQMYLPPKSTEMNQNRESEKRPVKEHTGNEDDKTETTAFCGTVLNSGEIDQDKLCQSINCLNCPEGNLKYCTDLPSNTVTDASRFEINDHVSKHTDVSTKDGSQSVFDSIPTEIVLKILSFLAPQDLCLKVAPISKKWYSYAYEPTLWQCLCFESDPDISSVNLCWIVKKTPHLKKLVLRGRHELTLAEVAILSECCKDLKQLDLGFCDKLNRHMIDCFVENCLSLENITVEGCQLINQDCISNLIKLSKLSHLNFSHCSLVDESIVLLATELKRIVSLDIDGMSWICDDAVICLISLHQDSLECLVLDGGELTDSIFEVISKCSKLKKLRLSFCELLSDLSLKCIKELPSLRQLKLRKGENFTSEALLDLFLSSNLANLTELDLSECVGITNDTLLQMSKCCGKSLSSLVLSWCWDVTETGLISIVDHCSNLIQLVVLGMHKITGDCLDRVPEEMVNLTSMDLRQCNRIKDQIIADMVRRKPDLKVLNYYGELFIFCANNNAETIE